MLLSSASANDAPSASAAPQTSFEQDRMLIRNMTTPSLHRDEKVGAHSCSSRMRMRYVATNRAPRPWRWRVRASLTCLTRGTEALCASGGANIHDVSEGMLRTCARYAREE